MNTFRTPGRHARPETVTERAGDLIERGRAWLVVTAATLTGVAPATVRATTRIPARTADTFDVEG